MINEEKTKKELKMDVEEKVLVIGKEDGVNNVIKLGIAFSEKKVVIKAK